MTMRQQKYLDNKGDFEKDLKTSDSFTSEPFCSDAGEAYLMRSKADKFGYVNLVTRKTVRYADDEILDLAAFRKIYVERKDFSRMIFYDGTGLPVPYVDKVKKVCSRGDVLVFAFIDNEDFAKIAYQKLDRARARYSSHLDMLDRSPSWNRFCTVEKKDGKPVSVSYIPYGERIEVLMRPENRHAVAEEKALSSLSQYYGARQYIWRLSAMRSLKDIFLGLISESVKIAAERFGAEEAAQTLNQIEYGRDIRLKIAAASGIPDSLVTA